MKQHKNQKKDFNEKEQQQTQRRIALSTTLITGGIGIFIYTVFNNPGADKNLMHKLMLLSLLLVNRGSFHCK